MKYRFKPSDKVIIDRWQKVFPDLFPHKPEPKKYLRTRAKEMAIHYAMSHGYSEQDSCHAMQSWCQGQRWIQATIGIKHKMQDDRKPILMNNRIKKTLALLQESFPALFKPMAAEDILPLKIGIHKDLMTWAETNGVSEKDLTITIGYWVRSDDYRRALKKSNKRFDLNLNEYEIAC